MADGDLSMPAVDLRGDSYPVEPLAPFELLNAVVPALV
jgi:hypothetical protein